MDTLHLRIQLTHPQAVLPRVSQPGDVAADVSACVPCVIPPGGRALVETGLVLELPEGFRARLHSRSGLSLKYGIEVGAGLIDQGFRHPLKVLLYNLGADPFAIAPGDRVAQLCIERYTHPTFEAVSAVAETGRSEGWGSSGLRA
ncbi:MAG: dUTP diphosphatase [Candidatus Sericytochromatia bacterium]|nr:dUTP diphosphatase [Candidatus Sericytochromatia bacterium]